MPPKKAAGAQKANKPAKSKSRESDEKISMKLQLIELVQGYPEIYDVQDPCYKKDYLRTAAWEAIAEALFMPGSNKFFLQSEFKH